MTMNNTLSLSHKEGEPSPLSISAVEIVIAFTICL